MMMGTRVTLFVTDNNSRLSQGRSFFFSFSRADFQSLDDRRLRERIKMDGIVRLSSRPAHSFFALLTLSLVSLIVFVFRRAPKHHVHYHPRALQLFERAVNDSHTSSILPSGSPRPFAALADPQTPSVTPSQVSSLPESSPSLPPKPIIISSSTTTTTTTTSIPSHTISTTTSPILSS